MKPKRLHGVFRAGHRQPQIWDPLTGKKQIAAAYTYETKGTGVPISLEGYGSTIIAFGPSTERLRPTRRRRTAQLPPPLALTGPWTLEIEGHSVSLDRLASWSEHEKFRYFSGTGIYRTVFDLDKLPAGAGVLAVAGRSSRNRRSRTEWPSHWRGLDGALPPGVDRKDAAGAECFVDQGDESPDQPCPRQPAPDVADLVAKFAKRFSQVGEHPDLKFIQNGEKTLIKDPLPSGLLGPVALQRI